MNDKHEIIDILKDIKRRFNYMASDYDFLNEVVAWAKGLSTHQREQLFHVLYELFIEKDELGNIFLDVLVRFSTKEWASTVAEHLHTLDPESSLYEDIVLTLMQLGYVDLLPVYLDRIRKQMREGDLAGLVDLSYLYLVDSGLGIKESSDYLSVLLQSDSQLATISDYMSVFVKTYCRIRCEDLVVLIDTVKLKDRAAGIRLQNVIEHQVKRQIIQDEIGMESAQKLLETLKVNQD